MDNEIFHDPGQREMMLSLFKRLGDNEESVCLAYMEAERTGQVDRRSNSNDMTPGTFARALWRDGKAKGWLA